MVKLLLHPAFFSALLLPFLLGCGSSGSASRAAIPPATVAPVAAPAAPPPTSAASPRIFTQTNDAAANAVLMFAPAEDGVLAQVASVPTGGKGSGGSLQNQGSLALNHSGSLLFVVNAGSDDFSVFRVGDAGITLASRTPSGGAVPVSVAEANGVVYLLNDGSRAGSTDAISGFTVDEEGAVTPIPNSTRALSAASTGAAQVALSPDGSLALITERGTATLDTFLLDASGVPGSLLVNASAGSIPFGFQFLDSSHVLVSEEGTNAVSSYAVAVGQPLVVTRSARNFQSATCWLAIAPSGRFLYTTNTTARTISAFRVAPNGSVALLGSSGIAARSTGPPIDAVVSPDGSFLYVVDSGGGIDSFAIAPDGGLLLRANLANLGGAVNGIVAL